MTNYQTVVAATSGLTNYWKFDGNANDSTGSLNVTLGAGYTTGTAGQENNALTADSSATKTGCTAAVPNTFFNATYSIEMWFKLGQHRASQQELMRMSNELALEIQTDGTLLYYYNGSQAATTGTYDDNTWHHLVVTRDSSRVVKVYVDGTQRATFTAPTGAPASASLYICGSQYTSQAVITGQMDEVALYNVALSSGTVTSHYAARTLNTSFDAATAVLTLTGNDPTYVGPTTNVAVDVDTPKVKLTSQTHLELNASLKYQVTAAGAINIDSTNVIGGGQYFSVFKYDIPGDVNIADLKSGILSVTSLVTGGTGGTGRIWPIIADFNSSTNNPTVAGPGITFTPGTPINIDVLSLMTLPNFYGFKVTNDSSSGSDGFVVGAVLKIDYTVEPLGVDTTVDTPNVSLVANDVTVVQNVSTDTATAVATLNANDVTVDANVSPDVIIDVATATVMLNGNDPVISLPIIVDLTTETVTLTANDPSIEFSNNVDITMDTPITNFVAYKPTNINGEPIEDTEEEDRYFVSTKRSVDTGDVWWRLNEISGTDISNRANPTIPSPGTGTGVYHNVTIGLHEGIDSRHSVQFNGTSYITENESTSPGSNEQFTIPSSLEFTFKTERTTQFLMGGADAIAPAGAGSPTEVGGSEFWLQDGKINFRAYNLGNPNVPFNQQPPLSTNILGFKNLADGHWHHIVVNMGGLNAARGTRSLEIWVDGQLEIRRFAGVTGTGPNETTETANIYFGMPDFVGGRPDSSFDQWRFLPAMPITQAQWFLGDMTEIVFRNGSLLTEDQILLQDDMMFGRDPIYPETARMTLRAYDASAKGNKKRLLVIDMSDGLGSEGSANDIVVNSGPIIDAWGNIVAASSAGQFHFTGPGNNMGRGLQNSDDLYGYQVFKVHARAGFLDNVTDNERLLDLTIDLNMEDYDVISVVDYPHTDAAWSWFDGLDTYNTPPFITGRRMVENLVEQIRAQVVAGKSLFVSDPDLAVAIGVINRYEFVPNLRERDYSTVQLGSNSGYYDFQAAKIDPWGTSFGGSNQLIGIGYEDQHDNTRQRVRELVSGLTDIPGYITTDFIAQYNRDPMATPPYQETFKYADRTGGLSIGDEFYLLGALGPSDLDITAEILGKDRTSARLNGWLATPMQNVIAGKTVTSFAEKTYTLDRIENNPYRDYAISIVVEPGDSLKGQNVLGKVYVNFTEAWTEWAPMLETKNIQIVPDNSALPLPFRQTEEQRKWSWSTHRGDWTGTSYQQGTAPQIVLNPDGTISADGNNKNTGSAVVRFNWNGWFPTVKIDVPSMAFRGFRWLAEIETVESGSVIIGVETPAITLHSEGAVVQAATGTTVELTTPRVVMNGYNDADTESTDADVLLITPYVTLVAGSMREIVDLSTPMVTLKAYNDLDVGFAEDNVLVLTLPFHNITLFMEER